MSESHLTVPGPLHIQRSVNILDQKLSHVHRPGFPTDRIVSHWFRRLRRNQHAREALQVWPRWVSITIAEAGVAHTDLRPGHDNRRYFVSFQ